MIFWCFAWFGYALAGCCFWCARAEREEGKYWYERCMDLTEGEHSIDKWVRDAREERIKGIRLVK